MVGWLVVGWLVVGGGGCWWLSSFSWLVTGLWLVVEGGGRLVVDGG